MKKAIKFLHISRKSSIFAAIKIELIMLVCCVCSACGGPIINSGGGFECDCDWHTDKNAYFDNPYFELPNLGVDEYGNNRFRNIWLEQVVDFQSINHIMDNINNGFRIAYSFDFKWNVSIDDKLCPYTDQNSYDISITPDNYHNYFNSSNNYMIGSPYIPDNYCINSLGHKHTLQFKLSDVLNDYDGTYGQVIWTHTWNSPLVFNDSEWWFTFDGDHRIIGTFKPDRSFITSRLIYINGQYENIIM